VGDANSNGWRFFDELYDLTPHQRTEQAKVIAYISTWRKQMDIDTYTLRYSSKGRQSRSWYGPCSGQALASCVRRMPVGVQMMIGPVTCSWLVIWSGFSPVRPS
jgi:hypothetical protein